MKRFTDCTKWTQNKWFRKLDTKHKLFWLYLLDSCDNVGVWEEDIELASFLITEPLEEKELLTTFQDQITVLNSGKKWWVKKFVYFQYGELLEENTKNRPHQSYIRLLKQHSLWIHYRKTIQGRKDKDKDKDKDKEGIDKGKWFNEIWQKYPNGDGKKDALRHFTASVKIEKDWQDINKALGNYLESDRVKKGYVKNGSTWFNNWRDWIDYKEVSKEKGDVQPNISGAVRAQLEADEAKSKGKKV